MHVQTDFESFSIDGRLIRSLRDVNILTPTTVQRAAFPPLLEGRDLALQAGPGTGRVLAWCLPVLHRLLATGGEGRVIVVAPGGDAAMNIEREIKRATRHARLGVLMPAAGVERTGASYEMFEREDELPDVLVGMAPSLLHFVDGTGYPLARLTSFVVDLTGPVDAESAAAIDELSSRIPGGCQRIVVVSDPDDAAEALMARLLRQPAIVIGTAAAAPVADARALEPEQKDAPEPPPRQRTEARGRRVPDRGPPESWPIGHVGFMVAGSVGLDELARIVRVEARGHTVVLVAREQRGRDLAAAVGRLVPERRVTFVAGGEPLNGEEADAVTICLASDRRREDLTANVLVLEKLPPSPEEYVSLIPILRCEPGDRIVSVVTPREVGMQYRLRLATGIRLLERRLPTDEELDSIEQAEVLLPLRELAPSATARDMELLRRVRTLDRADEILAVGLAGLLGRRAAREPDRLPGRPEPLLRPGTGRLAERGAGKRGGVPMVELELSCGSEDGVEAGYLAQWLQSRLAMRVSELGPIKVLERRSLVTVPRERAGEASVMLGELSFGGTKVAVSGGTEPGKP
jgi:ATP-dependent RNA helicase DeaD